MRALSQKKQINYWQTSSARAWKTALYLFEGKQYDACLFFSHLAIEKLLKGLIVINTGTFAPYIHDLSKLAYMAGIKMSADAVENLRHITTFNIAGRYDSEKLDFHKKCTQPYTLKNVELCKKIILWLKKEYQKK